MEPPCNFAGALLQTLGVGASPRTDCAKPEPIAGQPLNDTSAANRSMIGEALRKGRFSEASKFLLVRTLTSPTKTSVSGVTRSRTEGFRTSFLENFGVGPTEVLALRPAPAAPDGVEE